MQITKPQLFIRHTCGRTSALTLAFLVAAFAASAESAHAAEPVRTQTKSPTTQATSAAAPALQSVKLPDVPIPEARFTNPWPADLEAGFKERAADFIRRADFPTGYGDMIFENKRISYGNAMWDFLKGNRKVAIEFLQRTDEQPAWNEHTLGIDLYSSLVLRSQVRKYFYFGPFLDAAYRKRMFDAVSVWSHEDPIHRHNPVFKNGPADGNTPESQDSWVDVRNAESLRAMRETSVYLFAEETGNQSVRLEYKAAIQRHVWAMWHIGMGEWDSEYAHAQTTSAYLNLYDFAKDPQTRMMAKAALDLLSTRAAIRYFHGQWGGPDKHDYVHPYPFGGSSAAFHLYFGDTPQADTYPDRDEVFFVTSSYRPPAAVVGLARKEFDRPVELTLVHPAYETWTEEGPYSDGPSYPAPRYQDAAHAIDAYETTYIGRHFQLGSLRSSQRNSTSSFKLVAENSSRAADVAYPSIDDDPASTTSLVGATAQWNNVAICLRPNDKRRLTFMIPAGVPVTVNQGITFVKLEKTWLAITPVQMSSLIPDAAATRTVQFSPVPATPPTSQPAVTPTQATTQPARASATATAAAATQPAPGFKPRYGFAKVISGRASDGPFTGFVLEVGEPETSGSFDDFVRKVTFGSRIDVSALSRGVLQYKSSSGDLFETHYFEDAVAAAWRNNVPRETDDFKALYANSNQSPKPILMPRRTGSVHVEAGGSTFDATFGDDGTYTFSNTGR